ncbi:hypothetical protein IE53DRAFT_286322 [Violaceomyces palustris]|uniref:Uncharacterized protein n=1 Tax=Violaceomyces palustris TaxID=1673888 RepID=A0ACD0NM34_9BASI|nr:hypothetical protein IE53DRAFT_286322 [Violaceomyces palustris]
MDLGDGPNQSEAEEREVEQRQEWEGVLPLPPTATNEPNAKGMKESHALCQKEGPWTSSQYKDAFRAKDLRREALWSDHGMAQARQSDPGRWSTKNDGRSRQFGSQRGTTPPKGPAKGWAEGEYRCPWQGCSSLHARLGDLYQHYNFKHNQTNRGFYCDLCLRFYPCQESLRDHRDRSHVGHPWKRCQKCDVKFGVEFSLDSHQHFHHHIKSKAKALGVSPKPGRETRPPAQKSKDIVPGAHLATQGASGNQPRPTQSRGT